MAARSGPSHSFRRFFRWALLLLLYAVILLVGVWAGLLNSAIKKLPDLERHADKRETPGVITTRDGKTVLRKLRSPTTRRYLEPNELSNTLMNAVIAAEDRRFLEHTGVDLRGITRAALIDIRARAAVEGGSTITQQLVKNSYVGDERSVARKSREALLAVALESRWSKKRILTAYLNTAYFGGGRYGIIDAADGYFGKKPQRLYAHEAALLAALLRAPEGSNPVSAPARARSARKRVLNTMLELGFIDSKQHARAVSRPIPSSKSVLARTKKQGDSAELAAQFSDAVTSELIAKYGMQRALSSGFRVRSTLDGAMQKNANEALTLIDHTPLDAALITLDVKTGDVLAMAQGGGAKKMAFNLSLDGQRQPGSVFKPFVLAAAYKQGIRPTDIYTSAPFAKSYGGSSFAVKNAGSYRGDITLEQATWLSDNTVFARLQDDLGVSEGVLTAQLLGIKSRIDAVPSVVLGALPYGVSPAEIAHAYSVFAAHGVRASRKDNDEPRLIRFVSERTAENGAKSKSKKSFVVDRYPVEQREVISPEIADQVTATLIGVLTKGTGQAAHFGRQAAGKTGTTDDYRDAWFVGYTPEYVTAVWVGHASGGVSMATDYQRRPVTGGTYPALIWKRFMELSLSKRAAKSFELNLEPLAEPVAESATEQGAGPASESGTERVPNVIGMDPNSAREFLTEQGFSTVPVDKKELVTQSAQDGAVIKQDPPADSVIDDDQVIQLTVGNYPFKAR